MKNLNFMFKLLLLPFLFILFSSLVYADETKKDNFKKSIEKWSGDISHVTEQMKIDPNGTASKTFKFTKTSYANAKTTITFDLALNDQWEASGGTQDYIDVYVNNVLVDTYSHPANYSGSKTITTGLANANGNVPIRIVTRNTADNEFAYIDNVSVTVHAPPPPNICTGTRGLSGNYYNDPTDKSSEFTSPVILTRIDNNINFEWGSGSPDSSIHNNYFSTAWTGTIYFPEDADYTFWLAHDDVMTLIIDGTTIYNNSTWTGGAGNFNDAPATHFAAGTYPITISFVEWTGGAYAKLAWSNNASIGSQTIVPNTNFCTTPSAPLLTAVDDAFSTLSNTNLVDNVYTNDIGTGFTGISIDTTGLQGILTDIDVNTGEFTFQPNNNFVGTTSFTYTIGDGTSTSTATVSISVTATAIVANDDSYTTNPGVSIRENLMDDDTGVGIVVSDIPTQPDHGTVTVQPNGEFTYTPDSGYTGTDSFVYEITDDFVNTDTATVNITIDTSYTSGPTLPFTIINPDFSRNVIGDYKIAGNTVLCLTEKTSGYGGTCHGHTDYQSITSNNHVSKYLDIDNNSGTWNSTSSYVDFTNTAYNPERGVVWAGLFWGGRISADDDKVIRYATENSSGTFDLIEVGKDAGVGSIDIETTGATQIKLKLDNGNYTDVLASTFHTSPSSGGETYAAFADVTAVLQTGILDKGKHVFTVANLTTMEGREHSPGAFGGWSIVVIYGEDYQYGKPRNISIYNGFIDIGDNDDPIEISGFKMPTSGAVSAQLSVFSGEGEYLYGRNPNNNNSDWMKISDTVDSGYDYMPGKTSGTQLGNRDNMFDAQLDGILRDHLTDGTNNLFNDLGVNNVGVDIDNYDVSDLMTSYRNNNENITSVYIKTFSDNDYITPSMIAFSAELYIPELCYDYTLDIDGHVISSENNEIKTPFGDFGEPLTTVLYLKSLEGDIDLSNVDINYSIIDPTQLAYIDCTTEISEVGVFNYSDACAYTTPSTLVGPGTHLYKGFGMHIGKGKTTSQGGTISAFEDRYIKFDSKFKTTVVNTAFEFSVDFTVDYGSGAVPIHKIFTPEDMCVPTGSGFLPELGAFNITDRANSWDQWNLYTQVSRRAFDLRLWAYALDAGDYTGLIGDDLNLSVEVEPIRADNFSRDANTACNDQHSIFPNTNGKFLHFNVGKYIDFGYEEDQLDFSYRSVAFRIWYLGDVNGTGTIMDDHNCTRVNQSECIDLYTDRYASKTACQYECRDIGSSGNCYDCLRDNYGRRVCSRDNFAIRPESFITELVDSNESSNIDDPSIHIANSVSDAAPFSVVAGYKYRFDINATNHVNDTATPRYIQHFDPGSSTHWVRMLWFPNGQTVSGCNDVEDQNISINLFNGSDVNFFTRTSYTDKVTQIGKYRFEIFDSNWTSADWSTDEMAHHFGSYSQYYDSATDCASNSSAVLATGSTGKEGCEISSVHTNPDRPTSSYNALFAQYYPSQFLVNSLAFTIGPRGSSSFVYINTLDDTLAYPDGYTNGVDENMSYNVQGTFRAAGFDDGNVSNFVNNCYAEDVNMSLYQSFQHATPGTTPNLTYDLVDYNISDITDVIRVREQGTFTFANDTASALPLLPINITQRPVHFRKDMQGAITMDLGYNFDRSINTPLNPRRILMNDFNISYAISPATVYFQMKTDHKIFGNRDLNQSVSFLYAKAKPGKFFYEDITTTSINTPVSVVVYCDLGFTACQDRIRILLNDAGTNEGDWWLSLDHRTNNFTDAHGDVILQTGAVTEGPGNPTVTPASPNALSITADATDNTVSVSSGPNPTLPLTVEIDLQTNTASPVTDRWLIYNEYDATVPSPFYKVRFIGDSNWTGIGDEGMVVGTDASKRNTKRLDW